MLTGATLNERLTLSRRGIERVSFLAFVGKALGSADVVMAVTVHPTGGIEFTVITVLAAMDKRILFTLAVMLMLGEETARHTADVRAVLILDAEKFWRAIAVFEGIRKATTVTAIFRIQVVARTHHAAINNRGKRMFVIAAFLAEVERSLKRTAVE